MIQYPLLCILLLPIVALTVVFWLKYDLVLTMFDVPEIIFPIYVIAIKSIGVLIPLVFTWGLIDTIGILAARKDEAALLVAFERIDLRKGNPVLMYKRKDKKTKRTVREWYSPIPMKLWVARQEEIEDAMNIRLTEKLRYGGKSNGNRIVMCSVKGREPSIMRGPVYDNDLEKDMEMLD